MGIPVTGISRSDFDAPERVRFRTFPFSTDRWISHVAQVSSIELQHGRLTDYLVVKGVNDCYGIRLSAQLDPAYVAHDYGQDKTAHIQRNAEKLLKILKAFDIATFEEEGDGVWVEPSKFDNAIGKLFAFSIKGATDDSGQPIFTDRGLQITYASFKGTAKEWLPVKAPDDAAPEKPVGCALNSYNADAPCSDDCIPF